MLKTRQLPSLRRREPFRAPKRRFVIYCEGEVTEIVYFAALRRKPENALIQIKTIGGAGVPFTMAESAVQFAKDNGLGGHGGRPSDSYEEDDEVWAVFDRDQHPRYDEAVQLCEGNGVGVGRSNPCFEIWLILHLGDFDKSDGRKAVQKHFQKLHPAYDPKKGKRPDCAELTKNIEQAEARAEKQLARREKEGAPFGAPSTTVFNLTRAIRAASTKT
jgi:RloB-like protein